MHAAAGGNITLFLCLWCFHRTYVLSCVSNWYNSWGNTFLNRLHWDVVMYTQTGFVLWPFILNVEFLDVSEPQVWQGTDCSFKALPVFMQELTESYCFVKPMIKALAFRSTQTHQWRSLLRICNAPASYNRFKSLHNHLPPKSTMLKAPKQYGIERGHNFEIFGGHSAGGEFVKLILQSYCAAGFHTVRLPVYVCEAIVAAIELDFIFQWQPLLPYHSFSLWRLL